MTEAEVLQLINDFIVANGNNEITADVLRPILVAILEQPNDFIGDLSQLQTVENTNLVGAINEVYDMFGSISDAGIRLYAGIPDPNDIPPAEYNIADFYIQKDAFNNPVDLWQYNGLAWVKQLTIGQIINDDVTSVDSTWSSDKIEEEIASAGTIPTLQQVTDEGSTTTNEINANGGVTIQGSGSEALKLNSNNINLVDIAGNSTVISANPDANPNVDLLLPTQNGTLALKYEISLYIRCFYTVWNLTNANTWRGWNLNTSNMLITDAGVSDGTGLVPSDTSGIALADRNSIMIHGASKLKKVYLSMRNVTASVTVEFFLRTMDINTNGLTGRGSEANKQILIQETFSFTANGIWEKENFTIASHNLSNCTAIQMSYRAVTGSITAQGVNLILEFE